MVPDIIKTLLILTMILSNNILKATELKTTKKNNISYSTGSSLTLDPVSKKHPSEEGDSLINVASIKTLIGKNKEALVDFEAASQIFYEQNNHEKEVQSLLEIGEIYYNWASYKKAQYFFLKSYALSKQHLIKKYEIQSLNFIGKYYHSIGDFEQSINYYQNAYDLAKTSYDTLGIVSIQNKIGKHYETMGNYPEAIKYYMKSLKLLPGITNDIEKATTYNHLGNIYHLLKAYDKAIEFHQNALQQRVTLNYKEGIAKSLNNLAEVLIDIQLDDSALICLKESFDICEELDYTKGMIKSTLNQGRIYRKQKNLEKALDKFLFALNLSEKISYDLGILNSHFALANIYKIKENNKLAIQHAKNGLDLAMLKQVKNNMIEFNLLLAEIFEQSNQSNQALKYFKDYHRLHNEMVGMEANKKIAELENQFQNSLKQRENNLLKQENQIKALTIKRKNLVLIFASTIMLLLATILTIGVSRYKQKQKANQELTQLNKKIIIQNTSLDQLNKDLNLSIRQQLKLFSVIAHELRNPLWWFRNLIEMLSVKLDSLDKEMIRKSLDSLNESANQTFHLMDNLLHWSKSQLGSSKTNKRPFDLNTIVEENIKMIRHFAHHKNILIIYKPVPDAFVYADKDMIQTVIRNILSNALKFTPENGHIELRIKTGDKITICIKDSGSGLNEEIMKNLQTSEYEKEKSNNFNNGLGLILCKEFVNLNGSKLEAKNQPKCGTEFSFSLPAYINDELLAC